MAIILFPGICKDRRIGDVTFKCINCVDGTKVVLHLVPTRDHVRVRKTGMLSILLAE